MPHFVRVAVAAAILAAAWPLAAQADVVVTISKSSQTMSVSVDGAHRYTWAVSTGIYGTPSGTFRRSSKMKDSGP